MAYAVALRDLESTLVSGASGIEGDLVEQIKDNCGYVVRGINWVLEQVHIHLLDAIFDKLAGDFSTVSVMAEDWRRTGLAAGILADNYRAMAAAVPAVWQGDTADAMTAKMEEFGENLDAAAECIEMVQMAIDDMLAATKAAMEVVAMLLSLIDDLCMYFAGSLAKLAKEIFTGGRRIKQIIEFARDAIRTLEALADLIPALSKTASLVAVTLKGLNFAIVGSTMTNNVDVGNKADDASSHLPRFPREER
ncbi:hypothetical protein [Nocardioides sp.]|uniref:hypothetical protein n=1 Tax=Nocardioides sp. TaxID=35761 RepID=UPI002BD01C4D|nr:hypothetical protein [Nocardioides sp.]HXH78333.1 hypothetical protein [Nocardioides sp.]